MRILGRTLGRVLDENFYPLKVGDKIILPSWIKSDAEPYYEVTTVYDDYRVDCRFHPRHYGTGPRTSQYMDNIKMGDFYGFYLFDEELQYVPTQEGDREDDI